MMMSEVPVEKNRSEEVSMKDSTMKKLLQDPQINKALN
jgi:hypothetical protein